MKKTRLFLAAILCVSLLAFAGCGSDDNNGNTDASDGTVTEKNVDRNDDNK